MTFDEALKQAGIEPVDLDLDGSLIVNDSKYQMTDQQKD